jgi:hypothetical protein
MNSYRLTCPRALEIIEPALLTARSPERRQQPLASRPEPKNVGTAVRWLLFQERNRQIAPREFMRQTKRQRRGGGCWGLGSQLRNAPSGLSGR